jgi:DNA polymerase-3 subunit delta
MTSPEDLYRQLRFSQIPSLILLFGQEPFLIQRAVQTVREAVLVNEDDAFNDHQFNGKEATSSQILEAALTFPVFAEKKLVTVKDAHLLPATELDQLVEYLNAPVSETCLLLVAEKIDARRKFFQLFKKIGTTVEFKPLAEKNQPQYVRQILEHNNVKISEDALALFCGMTGGSLHEIHAELEKLINYIGTSQVIDVKDIQAVVSRGRAENIFELGRAVGQGHSAQALTLVWSLTASGEAPLKILSMLVRHFRQLWKVRELQVKKYPRKDIARLAGVPFFVVDGLIQQGKRFSRRDFVRMFEMFIETDLAMKSSGADSESLLDRLVLKLAQGRAK